MKKLHRLIAVPLLFGFFLSAAAAQDVAPHRHLVHDWSTRRVVFTGLTPENVAAVAEGDPRAWHSWEGHARHRFEHSAENSETALEPDPRIDTELDTQRFPKHRHHHHGNVLARDWQMPIDTLVGADVSPAKFSFDINAAPDCVNDYIVFPANGFGDTPGSSGLGVRASLIAFNNLYTGPGPSGICPTPLSPATQPSILFAYNTATMVSGMVYLSPTLSLDGKKIAFIESNNGSGNNYAAFHVLTWKSGEGTAWNDAAAPGDCSSGNSCMTTLVLNNTHSDSNSSPFIDYAHDTAYVADDAALLHKIKPVFNGTPAEVTGGGWPVQLTSAPTNPHSPTYDSVSGRVLIPDNSGTLYVVDATSGSIVNKAPLGATIGPSDPLLDSSSQTVFLFGPDSSLNPSVWQLDTSGVLLRKLTIGSFPGSANVHTGAFDNNYFTNPSSGLLYFAASLNGVASLFAVGFTGTTMNSSFLGPLTLSTNTMTSVPTAMTEVFNPSFSSAKDRLFLGIDEDCTAGSPNACIESFDISNGFPSGILNSFVISSGGGVPSIGGIVIDNVSSSEQASSIYFEALTNGPNAIKLTQSGLQ